MLRINLWSGPRNVSTAFMYSFAQRADTRVVDEPLYAHYLRVTGIDHPGRADTLAQQDADGERVIREVILGEHDRPVVFFKQMAKHLIGVDEAFLAHTEHILLIRDPRQVLQSYAKVIQTPNAADVGYQRQHEIWQQLQAIGKTPIILDGIEIRRDPEGVLGAMCAQLGLAFDPQMLQWPAGPRPEDGPWAPYWYRRVHQSTGFEPYRGRELSLPPHLASVADELMPYYEPLHALAIKGRNQD